MYGFAIAFIWVFVVYQECTRIRKWQINLLFKFHLFSHNKVMLIKQQLFYMPFSQHNLFHFKIGCLIVDNMLVMVTFILYLNVKTNNANNFIWKTVNTYKVPSSQCINCLESWEYDKFIFCCPIPVLLVVYWNVWTSLLCKSEIAVYCFIFNRDKTMDEKSYVNP